MTLSLTDHVTEIQSFEVQPFRPKAELAIMQGITINQEWMKLFLRDMLRNIGEAA